MFKVTLAVMTRICNLCLILVLGRGWQNMAVADGGMLLTIFTTEENCLFIPSRWSVLRMCHAVNSGTVMVVSNFGTKQNVNIII